MTSKKSNPAPLAAGRALDSFDRWQALNWFNQTKIAVVNQLKFAVALVCAIDPAMLAALALAFAGSAN
jgi:hypothetical protein